MPRKATPETRRRGISVSIDPSDEEFLRITYPGTFSDAVRSAIREAQMYRQSIGATDTVASALRDKA